MVSKNMGAQADAPGISRAQIFAVTRSKKDLYHAMVANGFVMPALQS